MNGLTLIKWNRCSLAISASQHISQADLHTPSHWAGHRPWRSHSLSSKSSVNWRKKVHQSLEVTCSVTAPYRFTLYCKQKENYGRSWALYCTNSLDLLSPHALLLYMCSDHTELDPLRNLLRQRIREASSTLPKLPWLHFIMQEPWVSRNSGSRGLSL